MKNLYKLQSVVLLSFLLIYLNGKSQVNFTITSTACAGSTQTLSLVSGTVSVLSNTWATLPAGAVFSAANSTLSTVNFPTAGIYTIAVAAITSNGLAYFTNTISVLSAPSLTLSQSSLTTCITSNFPLFSKPVNLTAIGATNYTWYPIQPTPPTPGNPGSTDVRPSSTSCFTVVGNTSGCESSASICVTVIPQFSMQVNPNPAIRCMPDSLKLSIENIQSTAVGPVSAWSYSWSETSTSTLTTMSSYFTPTVLVYPTSATAYTAEMRDSRNCASLPVIVNVSLQNCTSIESNTIQDFELHVFPNPIVDELSWKLNFLNSPLEQVTITNAIGQIVYKDKSPKMKDTIDLRFLSKGLYFINFRTEKGERIRKFIKE